jgi:hypothetical protein
VRLKRHCCFSAVYDVEAVRRVFEGGRELRT